MASYTPQHFGCLDEHVEYRSKVQRKSIVVATKIKKNLITIRQQDRAILGKSGTYSPTKDSLKVDGKNAKCQRQMERRSAF